MSTLYQEVEQLLYEGASTFSIAKLIKQDIARYNTTLPEIFTEAGGKDFLLKHTRKIDTTLQLIYKIALREMFDEYMPPKHTIPITLAALGSYGREQLCVHSDIDLMIVYKETPGYQITELIEKILYLIWDSGLKLGHRVHELSELPEVARSDITIKSAILESRYLEGSRHLWTGVENRITEIRKEEPDLFIRQKLDERRRMRKRFPFSMEPNLKEGSGGFRDANLVFWIGKLLHNVPRAKDLPEEIVQPTDYRGFRIALEFLFRVRSALHLLTGKKEDTLRLEYIPEIAQMLGFAPNADGQTRLAKKVAESLHTLHLFSRIWIERLIGKRLPDAYEEYLLPDTLPEEFGPLLSAICRQAQKPFDTHPKLLAALVNAQKPQRPDQTIYAIVGDIFNQPSTYSILKALSQARVLGYTIPPIAKVIDLPQFDGYHHYSVDTHSLRALYHLEHIDDPLLQELYELLTSEEKQLLKIVVFLHDAGKGRKQDHHITGTSIFANFAQKLGVKSEHITMGKQLIRYHTYMSTTAQTEDLYSEKTILQFASRFGSKKMLDLIYLLTYADLSGVGPGIYSSFNAKLIRTLYQQSLEALQHDHLLDTAARRLRKVESLERSAAFKTLPRELRQKILSIPSNEFFVRHSTKEIIAISEAAYRTNTLNYTIENTDHLTIEIIRKHNITLSYLLSKLSRLSVTNMEIVKLFDDLKYFRICFNETLTADELPYLEQIIKEAFELTTEIRLPKPQIKKEEVAIDCEHSKEYGTLRLHTRDQKGLMGYVINLFDRLSIDIASAKVHTTRQRVKDLFLIEKNGNFCHNTETIINELTE